MRYGLPCKLGEHHHGFDITRYQDRVRGSQRAGLFYSGNGNDFCAKLLGNVRTDLRAPWNGRVLRGRGLHTQSKS